MLQYVHRCLIDPIDRNDYRVADYYSKHGLVGGAAIPESFINPYGPNAGPYVVPPLDQGPLGSCVWNAIARQLLFEYLRANPAEAPRLLDLVTQHPNQAIVSRLDGYYRSRKKHQAEGVDYGTYPRCGYQALREGFVLEALWPYDPGKVTKPAPLGVIRHRIDQKNDTHYYRLPEEGSERLQHAKRLLLEGRTITASLPVDEVLEKLTPGTTWRYGTGAPSVGRHYILIVGYEKGRLLCLNSWGSSWGDGGYFWLDESTFMNGMLTLDCYVLTAAALPSELVDQASLALQTGGQDMSST
jgi:hypothetical protein